MDSGINILLSKRATKKYINSITIEMFFSGKVFISYFKSPLLHKEIKKETGRRICAVPKLAGIKKVEKRKIFVRFSPLFMMIKAQRVSTRTSKRCFMTNFV